MNILLTQKFLITIRFYQGRFSQPYRLLAPELDRAGAGALYVGCLADCVPLFICW